MEKVLYIHGLGSSPVPDKIKLIEGYAEVFALHLDYENDTDAYRKLDKLVKTKEITALIGSSLGGLISFHLSQRYGLPCLLFNPALYREVHPSYGMETRPDKCPRRLVVLGGKDTVVDPLKVRSILEQYPDEDCRQEIIMNKQMGHQINLANFEQYVHWFFNS